MLLILLDLLTHIVDLLLHVTHHVLRVVVGCLVVFVEDVVVFEEVFAQAMHVLEFSAAGAQFFRSGDLPLLVGHVADIVSCNGV